MKNHILKEYLDNYLDVPEGTGRIIPLVIIESLALCVSCLISIYFVKFLNFSSFQVGKLISVQSLGTCAGSLLAGYLTTRISAIKVSVAGFFLYALGLGLLSILKTYEYLLMTQFICGVAGVFMMISNLTALIKLSENDLMRNRIIVLQSVVFNLSFSICSFFMGFLNAASLQLMFSLFSGLLLISGIILLMQKDFSIHHEVKKNAFRKGLRLNVPNLILIIPAIFLYGVIYSLVKIYFPIEAVSRFDNHLFGWILMSVNPIMIIFVQPLLIGRLKNVDNNSIIIGGSLLLGVGYFLFGASNHIAWCLLFIVLATSGEMLFSPISKKIAATSFGDGNEGLGLATWKMTYYFSGVFGAYFVGLVSENYKNFNIWSICVPLSLIIILITLGYSSYMNYHKEIV